MRKEQEPSKQNVILCNRRNYGGTLKPNLPLRRSCGGRFLIEKTSLDGRLATAAAASTTRNRHVVRRLPQIVPRGGLALRRLVEQLVQFLALVLFGGTVREPKLAARAHVLVGDVFFGGLEGV